VKVRHDEGVANHIGSEPCVAVRGTWRSIQTTAKRVENRDATKDERRR
jgi:hypothetical protein